MKPVGWRGRSSADGANLPSNVRRFGARPRRTMPTESPRTRKTGKTPRKRSVGTHAQEDRLRRGGPGLGFIRAIVSAGIVDGKGHARIAILVEVGFVGTRVPRLRTVQPETGSG